MNYKLFGSIQIWSDSSEKNIKSDEVFQQKNFTSEGEARKYLEKLISAKVKQYEQRGFKWKIVDKKVIPDDGQTK